jgi:hypothetical protein
METFFVKLRNRVNTIDANIGKKVSINAGVDNIPYTDKLSVCMKWILSSASSVATDIAKLAYIAKDCGLMLTSGVSATIKTFFSVSNDIVLEGVSNATHVIISLKNLRSYLYLSCKSGAELICQFVTGKSNAILSNSNIYAHNAKCTMGSDEFTLSNSTASGVLNESVSVANKTVVLSEAQESIGFYNSNLDSNALLSISQIAPLIGRYRKLSDMDSDALSVYDSNTIAETDFVYI